MIKMKRIGLIISTALVILVSPGVSAVEPLDVTRLELVRAGCVSAQTTMQHVLRSDTVARINRGRAYESTIKLLAAFNSRAALNTFDVSSMVQITAQFESELRAFKSGWIDYETSLKDTLRIRCQEEPQVFYDALVKTRTLRGDMTQRIVKLDTLLVNYDQGLTSIQAQVISRAIEL